MKNPWIGLPATLLALLALPAASQDAPVTVEQIISLENPSFSADAVLGAGLDGKVYLTSGGNSSFVLRMNPDGSGKFGSSITYAAANATANADGWIASANGHFAHKLSLYSPTFAPAAQVEDFLVSDQVGWDAPAHVEAGPSGDFYGVDQHRDRIVRITAQGKIVTSYAIPHEPAGSQGLVEDFRVSEKTQTLYVLSRAGQIRAIGFDGKKRWGGNFGVGHRSGGFDCGPDGTLYTLERQSDVVRKRSVEGAPAGELKLSLEGRRPSPSEHGWTEMRILGGELLLKRRHPTELFERCDLASGALRGAVSLDHERLSMTFPRSSWTAGESLPFSLRFSAGAGRAEPAWHVWARPLHGHDYRELSRKQGALQVPADFAGLYQIKVTPELIPWQRGRASEYLVQTTVEVRRAGTQGVAAVVTPSNRVPYARGDEIPFERSGPVTEVRLQEGDRILATLPENRVPRDLTAKLAPGSYALVPVASGATPVSAALQIGPGATGASFPVIQYGDYGALYPSAGFWNSPDLAAAHVERTSRLGVNLLVDRIGSHTQEHDVAWDSRAKADQEALAKRFPDLARSVPGLPPLLDALAGYGSRGQQQMAILMYMDAGLPLGAPGFDHRKPDELVRTVSRVTEALKGFSAFRGWSWASNWWIFEGRGSKAARSPAEKAAYEEAIKRARATGAWDPVLDEVSQVRLSWAVEAQELFRRTLQTSASHLVTAVAGPYRNVECYPPTTFSNVDEVDLQAQWEQIALPYHAPQSVDFYKRPGKRAWVHPEAWNDAGTGDQLLPTLLSALMRGADGIGVSGPVAPWMGSGDGLPHDPRSSHYGTVSVFRAANDLLKRYGAWWSALEPHDPVAIAVSGRQLKIDEWLGQGVTGGHFARLLEAWAACLHAHAPATYVFADDLKPGIFDRYKAVLVVGQRVQMEPALEEALRAAKSRGVSVFFDGTCREELVRDFAPLGTAFDRFEKDTHPASDDAAYWRFPEYLRTHLPALQKALGALAPSAVDPGFEEVFVSERRSEEGRYVFVVNNTTPALEPGQLWRVSLCVASRVPLEAPLRLGKGHVYDVFGLRKVESSDGQILADLRSLPARIFAVLPAPIARVALSTPEKALPGEKLRFTVRVLDEGGRPIRAAIPVCLKLTASDGRTIEERGVTAGSEGASGEFVVPLNAGPVALEATELLSGRSVRGSPLRPTEAFYGPHLRDVALVGDGALAVFNAMNWDHNLYAVDVESGKLRWRQRAGNYFAFAPQPVAGGFAVQGFRFDRAEGYQLYLADHEGRLERRFGLYGLPGRLPHRFVPGILRDRIDQFAAPEDGSYIASSGDLGVAVFSRPGALLWAEDAWKTGRHPALLAAPDSGRLLVVQGMSVSERDAQSGRVRWSIPLAPTGEAREIRVSRDGKTVAVLATPEGGRIFVLRDGKRVAEHATGGGTACDISADGTLLAVATGNQLKVFSSLTGLRFTLGGDDFLRFPRFSPDGRRIVATSDLGTLYVARTEGELLLERDLGAVSVPCWLKGDDLLLGDWMGRVSRLDGNFREKWSIRLSPEQTDLRGKILTADPTPEARVTRWINAEPQSAPLTPNLLSEKEVRITFVAQQNHIQFARPTAALVDGKGSLSPEPWLRWGDVGSFAETSPFNYILIDTFRTRLRVTGITLAEDPGHPESWLRDVTLEGWNAQKEEWQLAQELRSDSAIHTHRLEKPIESARFRLVLPWGVCGNIRLAQIVLHGEKLGSAHPDVAAKKPLAVLFDEGDDLKGYLVTGPLAFRFDGAYSGGRCLALKADGKAAPPWQPPFGHVLPNWDFEIAEHPEPGQYRYLQFAWRALAKETQGITLGLWGANYGEKLLCHSGKLSPEEGSIPKKISEAPPQEWGTVRLDLWEIYKKPVRIRSMSTACQGGPAAFDQIVLGRREADLPPPR